MVILSVRTTTGWAVGLWVVAGLVACGETKEVSSGSADSAALTPPPAPVVSAPPLAQYSVRFRDLMQNDRGALRGIAFGDAVEKVRATETAQPLTAEDGPDRLAYQVDLGNYENLDVRYHLNDQHQVWGFTLDIYLNKQAAVDSLFNDFRGYFTQRYGKSTSVNERNLATWVLGDTLVVNVKDVGIRQAPGMQVKLMHLKKLKETGLQPGL